MQAPNTKYESVASDYEMFITANISTALNLDSSGHPDIIGNLARCGPRTFQVKCALSIKYKDTLVGQSTEFHLQGNSS